MNFFLFFPPSKAHFQLVNWCDCRLNWANQFQFHSQYEIVQMIRFTRFSKLAWAKVVIFVESDIWWTTFLLCSCSAQNKVRRSLEKILLIKLNIIYSLFLISSVLPFWMTFLSLNDLMCVEYVIFCWHLQAQQNGLFIWKKRPNSHSLFISLSLRSMFYTMRPQWICMFSFQIPHLIH